MIIALNLLNTKMSNLKKDKVEKNLNKWFDAINEEYLKQSNSLILQSNSSEKNKTSDIKEGF